MSTTYDVRIWKIEIYNGKRGSTYTVRWATAGERHREPFKTSALADSFRSGLIAAARKGEAFDVGSGRPDLDAARECVGRSSGVSECVAPTRVRLHRYEMASRGSDIPLRR